jgi:hypothetical protein
MKRNTIPKTALAYLIVGLLFSTVPFMISRYTAMPDSLHGFLIGLGLSLEVIALVKIQRSRKNISGC